MDRGAVSNLTASGAVVAIVSEVVAATMIVGRGMVLADTP
jgi:hypothetical protein